MNTVRFAIRFERPRAPARFVGAGSQRMAGTAQERAQRKSKGTTRLSQWLRQDSAVYDEFGDNRDTPAEGEEFG